MSFKSRLLMAMIIVTMGACLLVSMIAYRTADGILRKRAFDQLTSLRTSRAFQVESLMRDMEDQIVFLGKDLTVRSAMKELKDGFNRISNDEIDSDSKLVDELRKHYQYQYLPRLVENTTGEPVLENFLPRQFNAMRLQHRFLCAQEKESDNDTTDFDVYEAAHEGYHDYFVQTLKSFGYYDVFLIDPESLQIVYTTMKEVDFATSLENGPHSSSNLATVAQALKKSSERDIVVQSDYDFYKPSYGAPAAFIGSPIYDGPLRIGLVIIQFPHDKINRIMSSDEAWVETGMGSSGETYLVGSDKLMRSNSRFLIEDIEGQLKLLERLGVAEADRKSMHTHKTSILLQQVNTEASISAFQGESDTRLLSDYRGVTVLSSFSRLKLNHLDWAVIAEMDGAEVFAPLAALRRNLILYSAGLMLLITSIAMWLAHIFTNPIHLFEDAAQAVVEGQTDEIDVCANSEFGVLANSLNSMVGKLRAETIEAKSEVTQVREVLNNVLPEHVADRLAKGETEILDSHTNIAVMVAHFRGWNSTQSESNGHVAGDISEHVRLLNSFVSSLDESIVEYGVEKVSLLGGSYVATCGISVQRLDHTRRLVDFAREIITKLSWFNGQHQSEMRLAIGIEVGNVVSAVIGRRSVIYDLWGEAFDRASQLSYAAEDDSIFVSESVKETLCEVIDFQQTEEDGAWSVPVGNQVTNE